MVKRPNFLQILTTKANSAIESVLAVTLLAYGFYINLPWYESFPTTAIGIVFETDLVRFFISLLYVIPPILILYGHAKGNSGARSWGIFGMFLAYFFFSILRVAAFGWVPIGGWLFTLALALVAAVIFINFKLILPRD